MAIEVIATQRGYYDCLREEGDQFTIRDKEAFSKSWMRPVKDVDGDGEPDSPARARKTANAAPAVK